MATLETIFYKVVKLQESKNVSICARKNYLFSDRINELFLLKRITTIGAWWDLYGNVVIA